MKMKKILALLLSLALFVGMIPASYAVSAEDTVTPATGTVSVENTEYFTFNRYSLDGDHVASGNLGDMRWDYPSIYDVPKGIYTTASDGTYRWPYIAFKVNAETDGNYSISAYIQPSGSNTSSAVSMIVDGIVHKAALASLTGKQTATGNVYLSKGEHIVIFTVPMAEYETQAVKNSSTVYPWCNYFSFTLSDGLSMVAAPTTAEINASVQGRRIQAGDTALVNYNVAYKSTGTMAGGVWNDAIKQSYTDLENGYFDKTKIPYIEYTVEAPADGKYNIRIGSKVGGSDGTNLPFVAVLVNDNVYKAQYDATFDTSSGDGAAFDHVNLTVDMKKGINLIKVTSITTDQTAYRKDWIDHDYIDLPTSLTAVAPNASAAISADDLSSKVLANNYTIADGAIGSAAQSDLRYDRISIEDARLKAPTRLKKWPFVALKVTAAKDGYYEFTIGAGMKATTTSENLAMFVDGALQAAKFTKGGSANIDASLYLTAGTHIIAITSPIPATNAEAAAATDVSVAYPWFNFNSFALSSGLTVENAPTLAEVTTTVSTTIQAEDAKHHIYDVTENGGSGTVVGGVSKSEITHTYDEVATYIDKASTGTPYVEYKVEAPADGDYAISVGFVVGTTGDTSALTKPFAAVLVNDTAYKAKFDGSWGKLDESELVVTLKKGINLIKVTSLTTEQNAFTASTWINQDYLIVDNALTVLDNAGDTVTASASNRNHMAYNGYTVGTDDKGEAILGNSNNGDMRYYNMSLESLNIHDGSKIIPYTFMKVNAPKDGYYDMTLKVGVATNVTSKQIGMILDGTMNVVKFATKSNYRSFIDVSVYLTEGEHEIYFTTPMPETEADALALTEGLDAETDESTINEIKAKAYPWMNMYYVELSGLELLDAGANLGIAGDLDNNNGVNAIDLSLLRKFLIGITVDNIIAENGDIHRDGNIDILDLVALKKAIVNGSSVNFQ